MPKATPRSKSKRASGAKKKQSAGQGQEPPTPQFTPEQNSVIQKVLSEHKNVFFTGAAGTGKSFVLKHIIRKVRRGEGWRVDCSRKIHTAVHCSLVIGAAWECAAVCARR